jgi:hypothetical protein
MTLSLTCPTHKHHRRLWNIRSGTREVYYCSHSEHDKDNSRSLWTAEALHAAHQEAQKKEEENDNNTTR